MIETKRVLVRKFEIDDLEDFYEYASVEGVGEKAGWRAHTSISESEEILKQFIKSENEFAIELKCIDKVIGSIGIRTESEVGSEFLSNYNSVEIGYVIAKEFWGQGIAPEVVQKIRDHLFGTTSVNAIIITCFSKNSQSMRVAEKCQGEFLCYKKVYAEGLQKTFDAKVYVIYK